MATPAQLAANRANARRSTGPRTADGKARARLNAVTHGAYARVLLLEREDHDALNALRAGFIEALAPVGRYEAALVERLSLIWWRIQRAVEAEASVLAATGYDAARLSMDAKLQIRTLGRIGAVEHRLQQAFERFLSILERRQGMRRRRGGKSPSPVAPARAARRDPDENWLRFVGKTWNHVKSIAYAEPIPAAMRRLHALRGPSLAWAWPGQADFLFRLAKTGWVLFAMGRQGVKLTAD